eukprot:scaffold77778_cov69-Phaeocystis_antarctica.AAC.5
MASTCRRSAESTWRVRMTSSGVVTIAAHAPATPPAMAPSVGVGAVPRWSKGSAARRRRARPALRCVVSRGMVSRAMVSSDMVSRSMVSRGMVSCGMDSWHGE